MKKTLRPLLLIVATFAILGVICWWTMFRIPGESYTGEVESQPATSAEETIGSNDKPTGEPEPKTVAPDSPVDTPVDSKIPTNAVLLRQHVDHLALTIGERNLGCYENLEASADYVEDTLTNLGYKIRRETFEARGLDCHNVEAELTGTTHPNEIVIVGGHYDSVIGTPGANDNGSGTASMLLLAKLFKDQKPARTIRFVGWTNEEPPYFQTEEMGSMVYAKGCQERNEDIKGALSLETMGYFSDEENSQKYPAALSAFYPSTGNFIGFVGNLGSGNLVRRTIKTFRDTTKFPSEAAVLPGNLQGVGWSDHWSFWQVGYQGVMVTDTAPFRYPHYHEETDLPKHIDFDKLAIVVEGLEKVIAELAQADDKKN